MAWEDTRNGGPRLWWRDLDTTTNEQPTDTLTIGQQEDPALAGRGLVYQSDPAGVWNVWRVALTPPQ